jgi:alpha-L-fucosidase
MKYAIITTKHHEGFCLWDSRQTEYKASNTPCGKDLLRPFVDAFRAAGLRVGFYYSLLDWRHPDFPIDVHHSLRDSQDAVELNKGRDIRRYAAYMRAQVRELLTNYGPVDVMWYDFSYPGRDYRGLPGKGHASWESEDLLQLTRELQPVWARRSLVLQRCEDLLQLTPELQPNIIALGRFVHCGVCIL